MLSSRALKNIDESGRPWRFTPTPTYDPDTNPTGLISFGLAENITFNLDSISYRSSAATTTQLPAIAAEHLDKVLKTHKPIQPDHVFVADSASSLGNLLGYNLAERGEAILVNRPVYGRFELDYGVEAGVEIVYANTTTEEAFTPDAVQKFEEALKRSEERGVKIRAVLLVNPHNPVGEASHLDHIDQISFKSTEANMAGCIGRCYPVDTLCQIARFCNEHKLHFICDEMYASCVFDSGDPEAIPFTSILSLDFEKLIDPALVHVLYGFSKVGHFCIFQAHAPAE
ncbi:hypothetical protein N7478_012541 [Penicillium angulare]|uniref:uncharacterized protein n=1 Tax=Penicillium angulare TaxID=116970 RepID=UPI0025423CF9|nr:uncharacterized protein N7478_012541 [Penicillium angulare]KAJ5259560.1 hypothetical protein N7478_012541 [Penicillium angulare]